jgi:peptide chain release factor 2
MQERTTLQNAIESVKDIERAVHDNRDLIELGEMEGDNAVIEEAENELSALKAKAAKMELESLLSGEADQNDAYLEVNSGAGGTEACDWANMLLRMYTRWAESKNYKIEILEMSDGEEAGIKSATIQVKGHNAYGWLKSENGVHRLVRISPFDSNARRHTSFASVSVSPVIDDNIDIQIEEKDLRIDTYRSSGAGGQHVNTTDSAVRITHIPTNIVVSCQNQRSQHQNKDFAMNMLKAKLYELEMQKRETAANEAYGEKTEIGWGHQIRSYVLHPYQMIKDLRTQIETNQSDKVLNGDLDMFLEGALAHRLGNAE